jgi:hypothetical protein
MHIRSKQNVEVYLVRGLSLNYVVDVGAGNSPGKGSL